MGRPKALLPDGEQRSFVARIVRTLAAAGLNDIVVVTGETHEAVERALEADGPPARVQCRRNLDPDRGQLSSLWVGLDAAEERGAEALLLALVDVPMVAPETVRRVIDAWQSSSALIARPAIGEKHGHPVVFDREVFDALREAAPEAGAKAVVHAHDVLNVEVTDPGCVTDVDTATDYRSVSTRFPTA